jgi:hypothetical protein
LFTLRANILEGFDIRYFSNIKTNTIEMIPLLALITLYHIVCFFWSSAQAIDFLLFLHFLLLNLWQLFFLVLYLWLNLRNIFLVLTISLRLFLGTSIHSIIVSPISMDYRLWLTDSWSSWLFGPFLSNQLSHIFVSIDKIIQLVFCRNTIISKINYF